MVPSPKGGWIVRKRGLFMLIDRSFAPMEGVDFYEGKVVKKITDKRGQEVPIIKAWPHNCNIKCGERCFCGSKSNHEFEEKIFSTENDCEVRIYICKKCGFEETYKGTPHSFIMKEWGLLVCDRCGFTKLVTVTDEVIKKYAVPYFPIEEVLRVFDLSLTEVRELHERCQELCQAKPPVLVVKMEEKLERSIQFWKTFSVTFDEFLRFVPEELIDIRRKDFIRVKYKDRYVIVSREDSIYLDLVRMEFYIGRGEYINSSDKETNLFYNASLPGIELELVQCQDPKKRKSLEFYLGRALEYRTYILQIENLEKFLEKLDIYDKETTQRLYEEFLEKKKRLEEEYSKEKEKWDQLVKNLKRDPVYQKLIRLLSDSAYGRKILYAVDPYNGFFGGSGIKPWEITEVFYEGLKKLGLPKF